MLTRTRSGKKQRRRGGKGKTRRGTAGADFERGYADKSGQERDGEAKRSGEDAKGADDGGGEEGSRSAFQAAKGKPVERG